MASWRLPYINNSTGLDHKLDKTKVRPSSSQTFFIPPQGGVDLLAFVANLGIGRNQGVTREANFSWVISSYKHRFSGEYQPEKGECV